MNRIPVSRPYLWGEEREHVLAALDEGWISSRGKYVEEFETQFAQKLGVRFGVATCNGTAALHLALAVMGVGAGDEVIVPDFSMVAPVFAVSYCGAIPVSIDVDDTWNIDPDLVEERITPRTRVILAVHTYGHPARVDRLAEIAERHNLPLVEDAAEALGATVHGRLVGTFGHVACFSFYANKILTTGEGGMLVTDDHALYERARSLRDMCFGPDPETRFEHRELGFNFRITSLQAAVGLGQLAHFDDAIKAKRDIAAEYDRRLATVTGIRRPPSAPWAKNVYWVYGILVDESAFGASRQTVQQFMDEHRIETRRFFTPIHRQPFLRQTEPSRSFPRSMHLATTGLYLPSYIGMTAGDIDRVVTTLRSAASTANEHDVHD